MEANERALATETQTLPRGEVVSSFPQRHTNVKASTTESVLSGGVKRRQDQSRQIRSKNRDYYINSKRERSSSSVSSHFPQRTCQQSTNTLSSRRQSFRNLADLRSGGAFFPTTTSDSGTAGDVEGGSKVTCTLWEMAAESSALGTINGRASGGYGVSPESSRAPDGIRLDPSAPTPGVMSRMVSNTFGSSEEDDSPSRPQNPQNSGEKGSGVPALDDTFTQSPQLGAEDSPSSSPMALSLRFLSRFRLTGGTNTSLTLKTDGTASRNRSPHLQAKHDNDLSAMLALEEEVEAQGGGQGLFSDSDSLRLPRLHSQAAIGALRRTAEKIAAQHDQGRQGQDPQSSSVGLRRPAALCDGFDRAVSLNLQALESCLDALGEAVTVAHRAVMDNRRARVAGGLASPIAYNPHTTENSAATAAFKSVGIGSNGTSADESEPLELLVEDLNTTLQSLFAAERSGRINRMGHHQRRPSGAAGGSSGTGVVDPFSLPYDSDHTRLVEAVASLFAAFVTTPDVFEALYWLITTAAARLLESDLAVSSGRGEGETATLRQQAPTAVVEGLLVSVGHWVGLATVTCVHALSPKLIVPLSGARRLGEITPIVCAGARSNIVALFTLLLRFSVGDFSPITQLWTLHDTHQCGEEHAQHRQGPVRVDPTASAYCRQLQEMCTEACATLLTSPLFLQFISLTEAVALVGASSGGDGDTDECDQRYQGAELHRGTSVRADTEFLSDVLELETLLFRPFREGACGPACVGGSGMSAVSTEVGFGGPASAVAESFLLRDARENAALLLCVICASVNTANGHLVDYLEKSHLFSGSLHASHGHSNNLASASAPSALPFFERIPSSLLLVSPRIAAMAFTIFSEFLSQAIADVSKALRQQSELNTIPAVTIVSRTAASDVFSSPTPASPSPTTYFDPYTGCEYIPPPSGGGPAVATSGSFQAEAHVSLQSVMNALKGLGDLVGLSYAIELLRSSNLAAFLLPQCDLSVTNTQRDAFAFALSCVLPDSAGEHVHTRGDGQGHATYYNTMFPSQQKTSHREGFAFTSTCADDEFSAAAARLDRIREQQKVMSSTTEWGASSAAMQVPHSDRSSPLSTSTSGGTSLAFVLAFYAQLRVEVGGRLTSSVATTLPSSHVSAGARTMCVGWDHFRPFLQCIPAAVAPAVDTICMSSVGTSTKSVGSPATPFSCHSFTSPASAVLSSSAVPAKVPLLPLLGADESPLATAFMISESVIGFYASDSQLASSIPNDVMQHFYSHHGVLFKVAETFSPADTCVHSFSSQGHDLLDECAADGGSSSQPHNNSNCGNPFSSISAPAPPPALDPLYHQHQQQQQYHQQQQQHQHITPLLLRCRDALSTLYCRAPSLVFTHWDLFSASILPFLSNRIDSFSRRHVLFILAVLFKDPSYRDKILELSERLEFQQALSAVMASEEVEESEDVGVGGQREEEEVRSLFSHDDGGGDEDDDADDIATRPSPMGDTIEKTNTSIKTTTAQPFSTEESELLDIILTVVMGAVSEGGGAGFNNFGLEDFDVDEAGGFGGSMGSYALY